MDRASALAELEDLNRHVEQHKWAANYHRSQLREAAARRAALIARLEAAGITVELKAKEKDHGHSRRSDPLDN